MGYTATIIKRTPPTFRVWVTCPNCFKEFWIYSWGEDTCPHCKSIVDFQPSEEK